jgi:nitrite reductase (NAD(P)H)
MEELDSILGTEKWKVKEEITLNAFEAMDKKLKELRGQKGKKAIEGRQSESIGIVW